MNSLNVLQVALDKSVFKLPFTSSKWKVVRASVMTAFTRSSDVLIPRVVLLSRNVKTAHSRYYKELSDLYY